MKRTHAYRLSLSLVAAIIGYAGWTLWSPDLAVKYHKNVDAASKAAAEAYIREHPPKKSQITWAAFWQKAANPYNREKESIFVANIDNADGSRLLHISCPQNGEDINLTVGDDGSWRKAEPSKGTPMIGRLFQ